MAEVAANAIRVEGTVPSTLIFSSPQSERCGSGLAVRVKQEEEISLAELQELEGGFFWQKGYAGGDNQTKPALNERAKTLDDNGRACILHFNGLGIGNHKRFSEEYIQKSWQRSEQFQARQLLARGVDPLASNPQVAYFIKRLPKNSGLSPAYILKKIKAVITEKKATGAKWRPAVVCSHIRFFCVWCWVKSLGRSLHITWLTTFQMEQLEEDVKRMALKGDPDEVTQKVEI